MNTLPDHIYFKDLKSCFIRINKSLSQFFGLDDPGQTVGRKDFDFFSGEHAQQAYEDKQKIIRIGRTKGKSSFTLYCCYRSDRI